MNIKETDIQELKSIVNRYADIHIEISNLEKAMLSIIDNKNIISNELTNLRESEIMLINKIEEETGLILNQENLTKLINT